MTMISAILGEGSFSTVYKLVNREGIFAAKVAKCGFEECILEECGMLRYLENKVGFAESNIIKTFGMSNGEFAGTLSNYLKLEFHEMTLLEYVSKQCGSLSLEKTAKITQELAKALVFISAAGVIHADIKSNNILVSGDRIVLTDFGSAVLTDKAQAGNCGQCLLYRSLEVVLGVVPTPATDVWSLAVVVAEIYARRKMFFSQVIQCGL